MIQLQTRIRFDLTTGVLTIDFEKLKREDANKHEIKLGKAIEGFQIEMLNHIAKKKNLKVTLDKSIGKRQPKEKP